MPASLKLLLHGVGVKFTIAAQQDQVIGLGLGDEEAVKGVAVTVGGVGKLAELKDVARFYG